MCLKFLHCEAQVASVTFDPVFTPKSDWTMTIQLQSIVQPEGSWIHCLRVAVDFQDGRRLVQLYLMLMVNMVIQPSSLLLDRLTLVIVIVHSDSELVTSLSHSVGTLHTEFSALCLSSRYVLFDLTADMICIHIFYICRNIVYT